MNHSTSLQRTEKGEDEVARRAYKLSLKKRSVLILLDKPRTVDCILRKSLFPHDEMVEEIRALLRDAFIAVAGEDARPASARGTAAGLPALGGDLDLDADISLSEAKFLLTDFCVDHFGTQSQALVDEIRACGGDKEFSFCLGKAFAAVERQCPDRLPALLDLVKKINETA